MKKVLSVIAVLAVFLVVLPLMVLAEELTITTYYPSPAGSYNELSTNIFDLSPVSRPADKEGRIYYDSITKSLYLYNGSDWVNLSEETGVTDITLAQFSKEGVYTLLNNTNSQSVTGWNITSGTYGSISGSSLVVNLSNFPAGIYEVIWGGDVEVDGNINRYLQLTLQRRIGSGDWKTIDNTGYFYDSDGAVNSIFETHNIEAKSVMFALSKKSSMSFRVRAKKSHSTQINARINPGFFVTVIRLSSV